MIFRSRRATTNRRSLWRRGQTRRLAAALAAAAAVWLTIDATSADPEGPRVDVVVSDVDAAAGQVLHEADVSVISMPVELAPQGSSSIPKNWVGHTLAGPVRAGGVLTDRDVSLTALAQDQPPGSVVTHIPLPSIALARAAPPGTRVDVLSTIDATVLAEGAVVLSHVIGEGNAEGPGLFVAVSPGQAADIAVTSGGSGAVAMSGSGVTVVLRPPPDR